MDKKQLRREIIKVLEKIPVKDRGWNEVVADFFMNNERFVGLIVEETDGQS